MSESESRTHGMMDSFRAFARSLLGLVQTRVELFTVELQEEKLRAIRLMTWFAAAIALAAAGLLVGIGTLAMFLWETTGYVGLVGLAVIALGGGIGMLWLIRRKIIHEPLPFAGTTAEFRKDVSSLIDPS